MGFKKGNPIPEIVNGSMAGSALYNAKKKRRSSLASQSFEFLGDGTPIPTPWWMRIAHFFRRFFGRRRRSVADRSVAEPLRAMVMGAPLEDARHLAQHYDRVRQESEVIKVSKCQMKVREALGNVENNTKLEAAEIKLQELKSNMTVLGKKAVSAMAAVEEQQQNDMKSNLSMVKDTKAQTVMKQFAGSAYGRSDIITDEAEFQQHQMLKNLYISTRSSKHFQRDIVRGVEGHIVLGSKQIEIGTKLSKNSRKYGVESCTSGSTLSKAALCFGNARAQMEKERGNLLKNLDTQIAEPLRAMVMGAPLEDARHLAQRYGRMRQESEAQVIVVSKRKMKVREAPGNVENSTKLEAAEIKLQELKSKMTVLGKKAVSAMAAVEEQQQRLTLHKLISMIESERSYHRRMLQILDQLDAELVSERQKIEVSPSPMVDNSVPPHTSYEEAGSDLTRLELPPFNPALGETKETLLVQDLCSERDYNATRDEARRKNLKEEQLKRLDNNQNGEAVIIDHDLKVDESKQMDFAKVEKGTRIVRQPLLPLTRNLSIREDTAKYFWNLDVNSAHYDPKTRSMREDPLPADGDPNEELYEVHTKMPKFKANYWKGRVSR